MEIEAVEKIICHGCSDLRIAEIAYDNDRMATGFGSIDMTSLPHHESQGHPSTNTYIKITSDTDENDVCHVSMFVIKTNATDTFYHIASFNTFSLSAETESAYIDMLLLSVHSALHAILRDEPAPDMVYCRKKLMCYVNHNPHPFHDTVELHGRYSLIYYNDDGL
jgi:hypothetical protein